MATPLSHYILIGQCTPPCRLPISTDFMPNQVCDGMSLTNFLPGPLLPHILPCLCGISHARPLPLSLGRPVWRRSECEHHHCLDGECWSWLSPDLQPLLHVLWCIGIHYLPGEFSHVCVCVCVCACVCVCVHSCTCKCTSHLHALRWLYACMLSC